MKERLEELMKLERLTSVKLAEILDVQPSNISHIISGRNNPSYDFIVKFIERFPHVNADWIISGKGDIYKSKSNEVNRIITNVNNDAITSVTEMILPLSSSDNDDNTQADTVLNSDTNVTHNLIDEVFHAPKDISSPSKDAPSLDIHKPNEQLKTEKTISRIILIYSDNSFEILKN